MNNRFLDNQQGIIDRCKQGDEKAFEQLYSLYAKAMYNVAYRVTGREEEAEDVLQDAFISAFKNIQAYRGDSPFGAWLKRIVINKGINVLRNRKQDIVPVDEKTELIPEEEHFIYKEELNVEKVRKALMQLPDGYRNVLSLYLLEGYDHQEIAEILQINESTSKSQLNRAKAKLKDILTEQFYAR
ncbi:MAG: RNA polymerase sigma factor [Chryseotalea sp.]